MAQAELELNDRRLEANNVRKEDPESTLVYDAAKDALMQELSAEEFERIEQSIKRIDWYVDLIFRNREIYKDLKKRIASGTLVVNAIEEVAKKYNLSFESVAKVKTMYTNKTNSN